MVKLAYKLMELVALSLGLPADRFHGFFKDQTSYIRLNHYNPCPSPHLALGLGRHQDSGVLTILNEDDVGGLEVKPKTDGEWVRVKSTPDAYINNIGDTTQICISSIGLKYHIGLLLVTSVDYVGVDFEIKLLTIGGRRLKLIVWDTGNCWNYFEL
ncbi:gibberellin 20 oxidase 2-like [Quercus robur]|uniref:gibberellin 20 oxidase 2-like n=1 Tax=Quercus robur TaxID=38942 RepID=UPI002162ECB1|nr:gibberellin 20 oxidase 2-like [Quercus robur]